MNGAPDADIAVFTEALRLAPEERDCYLSEACKGDAEFRRRVEALLQAYEQAGDFLGISATDRPARAVQASPAGEKPGDRIGHYRLLQQIGEGGCGVVYMAQQEAPVRRRVALKIIKPGMDTKSVIARFEAERQALALMDHPNIAHVFDADATETGRPYFVMELVEGIKITDYCDRQSLSTSARLELFLQVCDAIQHAHQKGIIHRDIKPSNVLVPVGPDGKPTPKVIDFGIAKATAGQQLTNKTILTAQEMLIGTPAYMSPEQAALKSSDVDTRTDIYSLGVLLYELLTGTTPFDTRELLKAGFDEVRRVIREEEPVRPSTRLSRTSAVNPVSISNHHGTATPKLIREMRGELDWIVMKALEKDRARRYATANGFAMDIGRYLSGDAVLARPPSATYKFRKLVARNRLLFSSIAIVIILLAAGMVVTTQLMLVQKKAKDRALHQEEVYRLEGLGAQYWAEHNNSEAERSYRQSFAIRRQFLQGQPPHMSVAAGFLGVVRTNEDDGADALLAEFPKAKLLAVPGYGTLFGRFADYLGGKGRWEQATNQAAILVEFLPDLHTGYHRLAPLLVACGNVSEYRRLCQKIITHFGDTQDPDTADQMAKDCLILPSSGADLKAVAALADRAVTRGTNNPAYPFFQCCKALAEYRQEHFGEAIKWAGSATAIDFPYTKAEAYAILSMAWFKSGQTNESVTALADCTKVIETRMPKLSSGDLGQDWRDWIIAHALQSEAKQLIDVERSAAIPANLPH